jgi:hypothetical protein
MEEVHQHRSSGHKSVARAVASIMPPPCSSSSYTIVSAVKKAMLVDFRPQQHAVPTTTYILPRRFPLDIFGSACLSNLNSARGHRNMVEVADASRMTIISCRLRLSSRCQHTETEALPQCIGRCHGTAFCSGRPRFFSHTYPGSK